MLTGLHWGLRFSHGERIILLCCQRQLKGNSWIHSPYSCTLLVALSLGMCMLSGQEEARFSYDDIHSFQANHSIFLFTTCACGSSSAALYFFLVTSGETACLTLIKELKQCLLLHSKQSHRSTLLPSKGHVATVSVDQHWCCIFPRHLNPLKMGKRLSEGMLPLCSGIEDYLCITRRTGNTALLDGHVPMDFIEKYAPKGAYPCMRCAAKDVCVPPVEMPRPLPIRQVAELGAYVACLSPTSVVSKVYLHLHPYGTMTPLPGHYSVAVPGMDTEQEESGHTAAPLDRSTSQLLPRDQWDPGSRYQWPVTCIWPSYS